MVPEIDWPVSSVDQSLPLGFLYRDLGTALPGSSSSGEWWVPEVGLSAYQFH